MHILQIVCVDYLYHAAMEQNKFYIYDENTIERRYQLVQEPMNSLHTIASFFHDNFL